MCSTKNQVSTISPTSVAARRDVEGRASSGREHREGEAGRRVGSGEGGGFYERFAAVARRDFVESALMIGMRA
jgi:hypothetical protein